MSHAEILFFCIVFKSCRFVRISLLAKDEELLFPLQLSKVAAFGYIVSGWHSIIEAGRRRHHRGHPRRRRWPQGGGGGGGCDCLSRYRSSRRCTTFSSHIVGTTTNVFVGYTHLAVVWRRPCKNNNQTKMLISYSSSHKTIFFRWFISSRRTVNYSGTRYLWLH